MSPGRIRALAAKDFALFFRNRFFAVVTTLALVVYAVMYFIMPATVDETLKIGLFSPAPSSLADLAGQGWQIVPADSLEMLEADVSAHNVAAGVFLPAGLTGEPAEPPRPSAEVYFTSDTPPETMEALSSLIRELLYAASGQPSTLELSTTVLPGPDLSGHQVPPRDRMRPLFAILLIVFETYGMATLITEEIEHRTIQALLVTPVSIKDLFAAKGLAGLTLAFGQGAIFMAVVGGLGQQPVIVIVTLILAALMVTGIGFLMASASKDMMSVLAWGVLAMIILVIPAMGVLFPGLITGWARAIPSYYAINTIDRVTNYGAGWPEIWRNLLVLAAFDAAFLAAGMAALRRRFQ